MRDSSADQICTASLTTLEVLKVYEAPLGNYRTWLQHQSNPGLSKRVLSGNFCHDEVVHEKKGKVQTSSDRVSSWRWVPFAIFAFQPFHPHFSPTYRPSRAAAGERLYQAWKHFPFLFVRSQAAANRCHASNRVPGAMKRNRATKPLPTARPVFQVNMQAYTTR